MKIRLLPGPASHANEHAEHAAKEQAEKASVFFLN